MDAGIRLNKSFIDMELVYIALLTGGSTVFWLIEEWRFAVLLLCGGLCAACRITWKLYYTTLYGRSAALSQSVPLTAAVQVRSKVYLSGFYLTALWFFPLLVKVTVYALGIFLVNYSHRELSGDKAFWQNDLIQPFVDELAVIDQIGLIMPLCVIALVVLGFAAAAGGLLGIVLYQSMQVAKRRTWITAICGLLGAGLTAVTVWGSWMIFDWMMWEFSVMRPLVCIVMALILLELAARASIKLLEKHYRTDL